MPEAPPQAAPALRQAALPLFLFSLVLFLLLLLSRALLLPRWAQVTVGDQRFSAWQLQQEHSKLAANLLAAQDARRVALLPAADPLLSALLPARERSGRLLHLIEDVQDAAVRSSPVAGAVVVKQVHIAEDGQVQVEGDVSHVSYASMSVLAQFVSRLQALAGVTMVQPPSYVREGGPSGPHSPFQLTLSLTE